MSNIKNGTRGKLKTKINLEAVYDFTLSSDDLSGLCETTGINESKECLVAWFDFGDLSTYGISNFDNLTPIEQNEQIESILTNNVPEIYSLTTWSKSSVSSLDIPYFGFTGYDTAVLTNTPETSTINDTNILDKSNNNLLKFSTSSFVVNTDDSVSTSTNKREIDMVNKDKFVMFPVGGNTQKYIYPMSIVEDSSMNTISDGVREVKPYVAELKGGFFQGFYKLDGYDYQTLPNRYSEGFTLSVWLNHNPSSIDISETTNSNILSREDIEFESLGSENYKKSNYGFFLYFGTRAENKFHSPIEIDEDIPCGVHFPSPISEDQYRLEEIDDSGEPNLIDLYSKPSEFRTVDNQFLLNGRSKYSKDGLGKYSAYDLKTIGKNVIVPIMDSPIEYEINPFLLYGRSNGIGCGCSDGSELGNKTVCDIKKEQTEIESIPKKNNPNKDIVDNAVGFRITMDGRIGYRYLVFDNSGNIEVIQDYTNINLVEENEWTNITLRWIPETYVEGDLNDLADCNQPPRRNGRLLVYINCYLKHVFYNFPEFIARRLDEHSEKQLGVPYNISLGGGSLGLLEHFTIGGQDCGDLGLEIEKNFAGTFIGKISQFKIFACDMTWCHIKNICTSESYRYGMSDNGYLLQENENWKLNQFFIQLEDLGKIII